MRRSMSKRKEFIANSKPCSECRGSGKVEVGKCEHCDGAGMLPCPVTPGGADTCPYCNGYGTKSDDCRICHGKGRV